MVKSFVQAANVRTIGNASKGTNVLPSQRMSWNWKAWHPWARSGLNWLDRWESSSVTERKTMFAARQLSQKANFYNERHPSSHPPLHNFHCQGWIQQKGVSQKRKYPRKNQEGLRQHNQSYQKHKHQFKVKILKIEISEYNSITGCCREPRRILMVGESGVGKSTLGNR